MHTLEEQTKQTTWQGQNPKHRHKTQGKHKKAHGEQITSTSSSHILSGSHTTCGERILDILPMVLTNLCWNYSWLNSYTRYFILLISPQFVNANHFLMISFPPSHYSFPFDCYKTLILETPSRNAKQMSLHSHIN